MKLSRRKRLEVKSPRQLAKSRRIKSKKERIRNELEDQMTGFLLRKGWSRSGPNGDVWVTESWKPQREGYGFERGYVRINDLDGEGFQTAYSKRGPKNWRSDKVSMTLHQAYKNQLKLDASGYERPKGIDDDLADLI